MGGSDTAPLSLRLKTHSQGWRGRTQLGGETRGLQAQVQDQMCQLRGKSYSQSGPPTAPDSSLWVRPTAPYADSGSDVSRDGDVFGDREDAACAVCHVSIPPPPGSVSAARHKDKGHGCPHSRPRQVRSAVPPCEPATCSGNEWAQWVLSQGRQIPGKHPVRLCPPQAGCQGGCPSTSQSLARAALPLCRGGNGFGQGQSLAQATEPELGEDKVMLLPSRNHLWAPLAISRNSDAPWSPAMHIHPQRTAGPTKRIWGIPDSSKKALSCLSMKICPRPSGRTKPKQVRLYLGQAEGSARTSARICLKCMVESCRKETPQPALSRGCGQSRLRH